ncbi:hypothetical protein [Amycolatopsis sp. DSM 110486]|uniref:hypothetical protein n=1 Tax=Amycolatopsis sp. DSM 110486 TaxID=2865832 RepID=UPI001C697AFE|nr:hypothetical protein [Amycolatopsis sp. DSM 110486]QYN17496.1 hypothetical protein K1T34_32440 [Amycolatopsis sp. DSM 110486]
MNENQATASRPAPPPLEPLAPDCSLCGETTVWEDGWHCEQCEAFWPADFQDEPGEWVEPAASRCRWAVRPNPRTKRPEVAAATYRCLLAEGHEEDPNKFPDQQLHVGDRTDCSPEDVTDRFSWSHGSSERFDAFQVPRPASAA